MLLTAMLLFAIILRFKFVQVWKENWEDLPIVCRLNPAD